MDKTNKNGLNDEDTVIKSIILRVIQDEQAERVLEVSGFDGGFGKLIRGAAKREREICIDRVDFADGLSAQEQGIYDNIYSSDLLTDIASVQQYDVIIAFHLIENMAAADARVLLEGLLTKVSRQVLVFTPEYPYDLESEDTEKLSEVRSYHPVFFLGMDFSYKMLETPEGKMQAYSFFPKIDYAPVPCDEAVSASSGDAAGGGLQQNSGKKLNIGYVLVHNKMTGAIKAIFEQMKVLADAGHRITIYYHNREDIGNSAIPEWSGLADNQAIKQVEVPDEESYAAYISGDEDAVLLTWMNQAEDFRNSRIPAALWEQGSSSIFGDYKELIESSSLNRQILHNAYRAPVHIFTVSDTLKKAFNGVYNREVHIFPPGIDTDFFCPLPEKNNEVPVVLLVGYPWVEFKGFRHLFRVLETAHEMGERFIVKIVSTIDFTLSPEPVFEYEKFIDPPQEVLAELYRNADVFLSASLYESFSLPPLEAMASGTAVIAMDCGGINEYAEPGANCLLCEQGDTMSMLYALQHLLQSPEMRGNLEKAGRETALRHSFSEMAPVWEECLYRIVYGNANRRK